MWIDTIRACIRLYVLDECIPLPTFPSDPPLRSRCMLSSLVVLQIVTQRTFLSFLAVHADNRIVCSEISDTLRWSI
jgi:hypothetical protein